MARQPHNAGSLQSVLGRDRQADRGMATVVQVFQHGSAVAEAVYQAGLHVEVRVAGEFRDEQIDFKLCHSENGDLDGT